MNNSFEVEGIEIRIQQKVLAEFVKQSIDLEIDYTINPRIYLTEEGELFFYDSSLKEPISLSKVEQFYERIRLVDGELRFYADDLENYVPLEFFVNAISNSYDKPNSLIDNKIFEVSRDVNFNSRLVVNQYIELNGINDKNVSNYNFHQQFIDAYIAVLFDGRIGNTSVFDFLVNRYTNGVGFDGGSAWSYLNMDKGDYLINHFDVLKHQLSRGTSEGKKFGEIRRDIERLTKTHNGIGKILYDIMRLSEFGVVVSAGSLFLNEGIYYKDGNDTIKIEIDKATNNSFVVDSVLNSSCGYNESRALNVFSPKNVKLGFVYKEGMMTGISSTGIYNRQLTVSEGCDGKESTVSRIESTFGPIFYDQNTVYDSEQSNFDVWFNDFDDSDNIGKGIVDYIFTPTERVIRRDFELRARVETDWTTDHEVFDQINIVSIPQSEPLVDVCVNGTASTSIIPDTSGFITSGEVEDVFDKNTSSMVEINAKELPASFIYTFEKPIYIEQYRIYFPTTFISNYWIFQVKINDIWIDADEREDESPTVGSWSDMFSLPDPLLVEAVRVVFLGSVGEELKIHISEIEVYGYNQTENNIITKEDINLTFPDLVDENDDLLYSFETNTYGMSGNSVLTNGPQVERFFSKRKILGAFPEGSITFKVKDGFVKPNQSNETNFNSALEYDFDFSNDVLRFGYINSTLGEIKFDGDTKFEVSENTIIEVWYEDFDATDNEGVVSIEYVFFPTSIGKEGSTKEVSLLPEHININYNFDYVTNKVARVFNDFWIGKFKTVLATGQFFDSIYEGDVIGNDFSEKISYMVDSTDLYFKEYKHDLKEELLRILTAPYPVLHQSSIDVCNEQWFDVPNMESVIPKAPPSYAASIISDFTIDYTPGIPCLIEFRLLDSTANVELDKLSFDFNESYSHSRTLGDYDVQDTMTLHIQLSYFGPLSEIKCSTEILNKHVDTLEDINSHIVIDSEDVISDDIVDEDKFSKIADRFKKEIEEQISKDLVSLEAPRVLRVQWRMVFPGTDDIVDKNSIGELKFDKLAAVSRELIGSGDIVEYIPEKFSFYTKEYNTTTKQIDVYKNTPVARSKTTINIYSFGELNSTGKTIQGIVKSTGLKTRFSVTDGRIGSLGNDNYSIVLSCNKNINVWYENKSKNSFDIITEKSFEGEISWIAINGKNDDKEFTRDSDIKLVPDCIIDNKPENSIESDYEILKKYGYVFDELTKEEKQQEVLKNIASETLNNTSFVDPNGPSCSQECIDDCPDEYICSSECYTGSLTDSGCGCCQCLEENDCGEGYTCNELNECVEI
jgi:hypothetical protein